MVESWTNDFASWLQNWQGCHIGETSGSSTQQLDEEIKKILLVCFSVKRGLW